MRELFILCLATLALACWTDCDCSGEGCCSKFGWCGVGWDWCQGRTPDRNDCGPTPTPPSPSPTSNDSNDNNIVVAILFIIIVIMVCVGVLWAYHWKSPQANSETALTQTLARAVELLPENPTPPGDTAQPAELLTEDPIPPDSPPQPVELLNEDPTPPGSPYWLEEV